MTLGGWVKALLVNGSLKGYDEYAYQCNFQPQPPIQGIVDHNAGDGATFPAPLFVQDRKKEGW